MNAAPRLSREIDGKGRTVRDLLAGLDTRRVLYQKLAEPIWNSERLAREAAS